MDRLMLRPAEAAQIVGVGRTTLYKLIKGREIPTCRLGKSIRIPVPALQEWARSKGLEFAAPITRATCKRSRQVNRA